MKSLFKKSILIQILVVIVLQGCLDEPDTYNYLVQLGKDVTTIDTYLDNNGISTVKDVAGIRMDIQVLGSGLTALDKNAVTVQYTGTVLGETNPFQSGTANIEVYKYIEGWKLALKTLPAGSVATVYIPSPLGYANAAQDGIPANSNLVFDINFKEIYISETEKNQFKTDTTAINTYLEAKNISNFVKDPTGIRYVKTVESGSSFHPDLYTKVKTKITIKVLSDDTKVLAALNREPSDIDNSRVVDNIRAVTAVLSHMAVGEKATVYAPSYLAFNTESIADSNNAVIIPPNSVVILEVELLDIL